MTGTCLSSASSRMRRQSSADCTAEPPGELTTTATATRLETRNAGSIAAAWLANETPPRRGRGMMTPSNRSTATIGARDQSRSIWRWSRILIRSQDGKPRVSTTGPTAKGSELKPPARAQHRLRGGGQPSIGLVQHEADGKPRGGSNLLARAYQDTARCPTMPGPQRKDHYLAGPPGDMAEKRIDPVRPMDKCHGPFGADHRKREAHPGAEIGVTFDRRIGLVGCRWQSGAAALVERRVRHNVVKGSGRQPWWCIYQLSDHHR